MATKKDLEKKIELLEAEMALRDAQAVVDRLKATHPPCEKPHHEPTCSKNHFPSYDGTGFPWKIGDIPKRYPGDGVYFGYNPDDTILCGGIIPEVELDGLRNSLTAGRVKSFSLPRPGDNRLDVEIN